MPPAPRASARSLANMAKRNLAQLTALVKTRLRRMQYRPALLEGFLASTGLDFTPFLYPPPLEIFSYEHVGIYAGNGKVWDANLGYSPYADGVQERTLAWETSGSGALNFIGAVRF